MLLHDWYLDIYHFVHVPVRPCRFFIAFVQCRKTGIPWDHDCFLFVVVESSGAGASTVSHLGFNALHTDVVAPTGAVETLAGFGAAFIAKIVKASLLPLKALVTLSDLSQSSVNLRKFV